MGKLRHLLCFLIETTGTFSKAWTRSCKNIFLFYISFQAFYTEEIANFDAMHPSSHSCLLKIELARVLDFPVDLKGFFAGLRAQAHIALVATLAILPFSGAPRAAPAVDSSFKNLLPRMPRELPKATRGTLDEVCCNSKRGFTFFAISLDVCFVGLALPPIAHDEPCPRTGALPKFLRAHAAINARPRSPREVRSLRT